MDISIKCKELKAKYCVNNGMLRCVEPCEFSIYRPEMISIKIEEIGIRIITLSCDTEMPVTELYSLLLQLERLLQIFDGAFVPLEDIIIIGRESENSYRALVTQLKMQRLRYFTSASFMTVQSDRLLKYEDVLSETLFRLWQTLLEELGVVNQMYLYATSDCGFTNDVKCAFLVELSESLIEIIGKENIKLQKFPNEGVLKPCLRTIINNYEQILFANEIAFDIEKILSCLVHTRVNIMHIKLNQRIPKFDGKEATLYAIKMSYLYRIVVLNCLGIDGKIYEENLRKRVGSIDCWNGIQQELFQRLR